MKNFYKAYKKSDRQKIWRSLFLKEKINIL